MAKYLCIVYLLHAPIPKVDSSSNLMRIKQNEVYLLSIAPEYLLIQYFHQENLLIYAH